MSSLSIVVLDGGQSKTILILTTGMGTTITKSTIVAVMDTMVYYNAQIRYMTKDFCSKF